VTATGHGAACGIRANTPPSRSKRRDTTRARGRDPAWSAASITKSARNTTCAMPCPAVSAAGAAREFVQERQTCPRLWPLSDRGRGMQT